MPRLRVYVPQQCCTVLRKVNASFFSTVTPEEFSDDEGITPVQPAEEVKRDISRLPTHLRNRMDHVANFSEEEKDRVTPSAEMKRSYHRTLYAHFGSLSGINPGILWPSEEEAKILIEDEKDWEPSFSGQIQTLQEQKAAEEKEILEK